MKQLIICSKEEYPEWFLKLSEGAQKNYIDNHPKSTPRKLWDSGVRPDKKQKKVKELKTINPKSKSIEPKKNNLRKNTTEKELKARKEVLTQLNKMLKRIDKSGKSSVLALTAVKEYKEYGSSEILGKKIESATDLAFISQVYRDPLMETFRIVYVKDDKIIGHNTLSQRLPSAVRFKLDFVTDQIYKDIKSLNADTYYLMHNHPSGSSEPSGADIRTTKEIESDIRLLYNDTEDIHFGGHIVINHKEYSFIDKNGETITIQDEKLESVYEKPVVVVDNLILGETIDSKLSLAKAAGWFYLQSNVKDAITFIGVDGKGVVNMAAPMPPNFFLENYNYKRVASYMRAMSKTAGLGDNRFASVSEKFNSDNANKYIHLIKDEIFLDIVDVDGKSIRDMFRTSIIPESQRDVMDFKGKVKFKGLNQ